MKMLKESIFQNVLGISQSRYIISTQFTETNFVLLVQTQEQDRTGQETESRKQDRTEQKPNRTGT